MKKSLWLIALTTLAMNWPAEAAPTNKAKIEEVKRMASQQGIELTFEMDPENLKYATGLKKPAAGTPRKKKDRTFLKAEIEIPRRFQLAQHLVNTDYKELCGIYDQGGCGSCVYNSVGKNFCDYLRVHNYKQDGVSVPDFLARQQLMSCTPGGRCSGEWAMSVAGKYLPQLGGLVDEATWPYKASSTSSCPANNSPLFGKGLAIQAREIDNSAKSMFTAVVQGFPVSITVGADNAWMSYKTGIYNYCSNAGTNHEVLLEGWDCEDSFYVGADGKEYCKFDAKGNLPNGVGFVFIPNSWSRGWGEDGIMRSRLRSSSGRLCNNATEEAVIIDAGLVLPDPTPPTPPTPPVPPIPPTPTPGGIPLWTWIVMGVLGAAVALLLLLRKK